MYVHISLVAIVSVKLLCLQTTKLLKLIDCFRNIYTFLNLYKKLQNHEKWCWISQCRLWNSETLCQLHRHTKYTRNSLATLSVRTTAVERPVSAIIRCILRGCGCGGGRWFGAQPLKHTRPSRVSITFRRVSRYLPYVWFWHIITIKHLCFHNGSA